MWLYFRVCNPLYIRSVPSLLLTLREAIRKARNRAGQNVHRTPAKSVQPKVSTFRNIKGGLKRHASNPEMVRSEGDLQRSDTSSSLESDTVLATPSKPGTHSDLARCVSRAHIGAGKRGKVQAISVKVTDRKRRKLKAGGASGSEILMSVDHAVTNSPNPWSLDARSFSSPFTPEKQVAFQDVLSRITPPSRALSLQYPGFAPLRTGSSDHSPLSPTSFSVSASGNSPAITGLCQSAVERWVVETDDVDFEMMDAVDSSPLPLVGNKGKTRTSRRSNNDEEMLFDGMEAESSLTTSNNTRPPVFGPFISPSVVPPGRNSHGLGFSGMSVYNSASSAVENRYQELSAGNDAKISPQSPYATICRGGKISTKVRGASTGTTMPSGPGVKDWRNKATTASRATSSGFDDVFGPATPPMAEVRRIVRKEGGVLKELNKSALNHENGAAADDDEMLF
jgi:hypothetical protein